MDKVDLVITHLLEVMSVMGIPAQITIDKDIDIDIKPMSLRKINSFFAYIV